MPRPRRFRKIFRKPSVRCFKPDVEHEIDELEPIKISLDEFESIRLKDYHKIKQKKAAEIMGISQPTFHRTLNSAREKIAKALVEGKIIKIKGGDYITDKIRYKCKKCGFEWYSPEKKYDECPDCKSEDIYTISVEEEFQKPVGQPGIGRRRGFGGEGIGAGPPRACKCPKCGYETEKTPGFPCRNIKCPKCGIPLCGSD
ncbi:MAG: DUF134 domain-containing protein [Methanobacteriaceae archaeon]